MPRFAPVMRTVVLDDIAAVGRWLLGLDCRAWETVNRKLIWMGEKSEQDGSQGALLYSRPPSARVPQQVTPVSVLSYRSDDCGREATRRYPPTPPHPSLVSKGVSLGITVRTAGHCFVSSVEREGDVHEMRMLRKRPILGDVSCKALWEAASAQLPPRRKTRYLPPRTLYAHTELAICNC